MNIVSSIKNIAANKKQIVRRLIIINMLTDIVSGSDDKVGEVMATVCEEEHVWTRSRLRCKPLDLPPPSLQLLIPFQQKYHFVCKVSGSGTRQTASAIVVGFHPECRVNQEKRPRQAPARVGTPRPSTGGDLLALSPLLDAGGDGRLSITGGGCATVWR